MLMPRLARACSYFQPRSPSSRLRYGGPVSLVNTVRRSVAFVMRSFRSFTHLFQPCAGVAPTAPCRGGIFPLAPRVCADPDPRNRTSRNLKEMGRDRCGRPITAINVRLSQEPTETVPKQSSADFEHDPTPRLDDSSDHAQHAGVSKLQRVHTADIVAQSPSRITRVEKDMQKSMRE